MEIPIDFKAVIEEATNVEAARKVPLSVSVMLDEKAPADLVAFVRSSFASAAPQVRVSINYFEDSEALFDHRSDMAVIAAGSTPAVGVIAAKVREAGIPVVVVTTMPSVVNEAAEACGCPIPPKDLIAPEIKDGDVMILPKPLVFKSGEEGEPEPQPEPEEPFSYEPITLDDGYRQQMAQQIGKWIVSAFREKRLAFAQAFDFVRKPLSQEAVKATSLQNAGIGLVVIIPGADMPVMTMNQIKMVLEIAAAYGQPLTVERAKELAAVVAGGFACRGIARQAVGIVPGLGWAVKAGVGYTGTQAMGRAAIEYFEHGGTVSGIVPAVADGLAKAAEAVGNTTAGRTAGEVSSRLKKQAADSVKEKAVAKAKAAPGRVVDFAKTVVSATGTTVSEVIKESIHD